MSSISDSKYNKHHRDSSTLGMIHNLCDKGRNDEHTVRAIRNACDKYDRAPDSTSPTTVDTIRGLCNNFNNSSATSPTTIDAIREVCDNSCRSPCGPKRSHRNDSPCYPDYGSRCDNFNPGCERFQSIITPVTNLTPQYSGISGTVEFRMRRKNKSVILQWEPFSGIMAASGVAYLTAPQSISNTPPYPMSWPIKIQYKNVDRNTSISVDPHATGGNIRFFLNTDSTGTDITIGDSFYIYAGSVDWIVN